MILKTELFGKKVSLCPDFHYFFTVSRLSFLPSYLDFGFWTPKKCGPGLHYNWDDLSWAVIILNLIVTVLSIFRCEIHIFNTEKSVPNYYLRDLLVFKPSHYEMRNRARIELNCEWETGKTMFCWTLWVWFLFIDLLKSLRTLSSVDVFIKSTFVAITLR